MKGPLASIRHKILIAFAAVVTIPLVIVAIYSSRSTVAALDEAALRGAADRVQEIARRVDGVLEGARSDVIESARAPWLRTFVGAGPGAADWTQIRAKAHIQARTLLERRPAYERVLVVDDSGEVRLRQVAGEPVGGPAGGGTAPREAFLERVGDLFPGRVPGRVGSLVLDDEVVFAMRLMERRTRTRGLLLITATRESIGRAVGLEPPDLERLRWHSLASDGPRGYLPRGIARLSAEEREHLAAGTSGALHRPTGTILAWARLDSMDDASAPWVLLREIPEEDLGGPVRSFRVVFSAVLGAALLLALLLAVLLSRQLTGPIETLGRGARRMAAGDLGTELDVRSDDELQELAEEFNVMARQLRDLTTGLERKVAEKVAERERLEVQLLQSERLSSIGLLAAGVAHEVHNPLATISMNAQMLLEKTDDPGQREKLEVILEHIDRISGITRGLLDFSRHTDGEFGPVDLHAAIDGTLRLVEPQLSRQNVRVALERAEDLPLVRGEEKQLQQVFLNVLMNSVQAMPGGGTVRIVTRRLDEERLAEVRFEDEGTGIDDDALGRVFDPFFTTKEPGEGTGLGLAVSYGIVQAHRGSIAVESKKDEGTTVTIRLPFDGDRGEDRGEDRDGDRGEDRGEDAGGPPA